MQAFKMATAMPITAKGRSSAMPPTNRKQITSSGSAITIRKLATIFAAPQVRLKARPISLIKSHAKITRINYISRNGNKNSPYTEDMRQTIFNLQPVPLTQNSLPEYLSGNCPLLYPYGPAGFSYSGKRSY